MGDGVAPLSVRCYKYKETVGPYAAGCKDSPAKENSAIIIKSIKNKAKARRKKGGQILIKGGLLFHHI